MRRTHIYLLTTAAATIALAAVHATTPHTARADPTNPHIWDTSELGETCMGTCGKAPKCCRIVAPAPPP